MFEGIPCTTRDEAEEEAKRLRAKPQLDHFVIKIVETITGDDLFPYRVVCYPPKAVR